MLFLEWKKIPFKLSYVLPAVLFFAISYFVGTKFIQDNVDNVSAQDLPISTWVYCCQLFTMLFAPFLLGSLGISLADSEVSNQFDTIIKGRAMNPRKKIGRIVSIMIFISVLHIAAVIIGWGVSVPKVDILRFPDETIIVIFSSLRAILGMTIWGVLFFSAGIFIQDFSKSMFLLISAIFINSSALVLAPGQSVYNFLNPIANSIGYPTMNFSLVSWISLLASLMFSTLLLYISARKVFI